LTSSISGADSVIPKLQFLKMRDSLVVSKYSGNGNWSEVIVNGTATKPADNTSIDIGDVITDCEGAIILTYNDDLIGMYHF